MWSLVAIEMKIPWRAAESMHWKLGEVEMAKRAGDVPFSLSSVALGASPTKHRKGATPGLLTSDVDMEDSRFGGGACYLVSVIFVAIDYQ